MRILVVGAGSIGGYFGARLMAAGRDVTFMVRAQRAAQFKEKGLTVISPLGNLDLPAPRLVSAGSIEGVYDLIILSTKAYDLQNSIEDFAGALGKAVRLPPPTASRRGTLQSRPAAQS